MHPPQRGHEAQQHAESKQYDRRGEPHTARDALSLSRAPAV
jgi:hypothetical protein